MDKIFAKSETAQQLDAAHLVSPIHSQPEQKTPAQNPPKNRLQIIHITKLTSDVTDACVENVCANYGTVRFVTRIHPKASLVKFSNQQ